MKEERADGPDDLAVAVVDLGFGDAGKGVTVDALVRRLGAGLVVRTNGGAQAGHNVVTPDGRHHCFAQLGAGSFVPGVRTLLGPEVVVHPTALVVEAQAFGGDPLALLEASAQCLVTTPFHQALGRLREVVRGRDRHGSCGVGVGETVGASLQTGVPVVRLGDLARHPLALVREVQAWALAEARSLGAALPEVDDPTLPERWLGACAPMLGCVADDEAVASRLGAPGPVVFEGAQGVLLDQDHGFHPHTTWSRCTFEPVADLLAWAAPHRPVRRLGATRTIPVRHGAGPFPSHDPRLSEWVPEPHNVEGPWQGAVRHGWPDAALAARAREVLGTFDGVVVTHVDTWRALPQHHCRTAGGALVDWPRDQDPAAWAALFDIPLAAWATGPSAAAVHWR